MYVTPKYGKITIRTIFLLGAQRENKTGTLLLYKSLDLYSWNFQGEVKTNLKEFGFMWECPDYFQLLGKDSYSFRHKESKKTRGIFKMYIMSYMQSEISILKIYISILIRITKLIKVSTFMPLKL